MIVTSVPVLQEEGSTIRCETLGAMWIFLILVSVGLVFMLYALVLFFRDGRQKTTRHEDRSGSAPAKKTREGVVSIIRPGHLTPKDSYRRRSADWSHGNGEIQIHMVGSDGHVVARRLRSSRKHS
jgi:hypothetical protein